jgi:hypothetical protein
MGTHDDSIAAAASTSKSQALVPLHRGFDWLIFGHFRMGRFSGATSSSMLRATPRRGQSPRRFKPTYGQNLKIFHMSLNLPKN